jgi:hypothetical protein
MIRKACPREICRRKKMKATIPQYLTEGIVENHKKNLARIVSVLAEI